MSETGEQIEQISIEMDQAKKMVEAKKSMQNLLKNPDFKKMIEQGYFVDEASRLVLMKTDPVIMANALQSTMIENNIIAVGCFRQYIQTIMQLGSQAERSLVDYEKASAELHEEDLSN